MFITMVRCCQCNSDEVVIIVNTIIMYYPISSDNGTISLESVKHRTQHIGIIGGGQLKPANETGTDKHGQFYPILVRYGVL